MARKKRAGNKSETKVKDYRHDDATRKNNPPAGIASHAKIRETPKREYAYNPHLPPSLRFDESGDSDRLPELLEKAQSEPLSGDEVQILAAALKQQEPWLEWAGKQEAKSFAVDPVALHIHERVSAKAIVKAAQREDVRRELFADPQQKYREAVQFYQHDVDWTNRLILGDSLTVMSSLAHREDLSGKVQMIYIDPPYGIKFASNFQPTVFQKDVKDKASDLTREREQIKAYRDTWTLGVHSYLAYLRDRLIVARELLTDKGSIFVQISDENVHRVRSLMDEVFGSDNFVGLISFNTTTARTAKYLNQICDYLVWYSKELSCLKYRQLYSKKVNQESLFNKADEEGKHYYLRDLSSQGVGNAEPFNFREKVFTPPSRRHWSTNPNRLPKERIEIQGNYVRARVYENDFPVSPIHNRWDDTQFGGDKHYVVQTHTKVIERCLLMTTDPGDLVLDPTCGGGTTAYVAEGWGRRWITIDTSRVAVALARQRLLTSSFEYYELEDESAGIAGGFINKTVPHITLKSIAQNTALDPIVAKHEPILRDKLTTLNQALEGVTSEIRSKLLSKLTGKEQREGKKAVTDADRRRWQLPKEAWQEWEVPFDTDPDWSPELKRALTNYREAWRAKMDEVNACIAASADSEELVDQPEVDSKKLRVTGPFTVEAVQPAEESLGDDSPIGGEPEEELNTFDAEGVEHEPTNIEAYLDRMMRLLRNDGVTFPDNQKMKFAALEPLEGDILHAEGN